MTLEGIGVIVETVTETETAIVIVIATESTMTNQETTQSLKTLRPFCRPYPQVFPCHQGPRR
jgi:predicted protein tyrosine phosphatase